MLVIAKYEEALRQLGLGTLEGVKTFRGELIKNHKDKRDIQSVTTSAGGRPLLLFLKRTWQPHKKDGLKSLLLRGAVWSQSRVEWENSLALQRAGIAVAEPVAFGEECGPLWEKFSFIITAAATGEATVQDFLRARPAREERRRVLDALARAVRQMHDAGLASPDLFTRHVFLRRGAEPEFCLIDMARLDRRQPLPAVLRARDLAALHISTPLRHLTMRERLRFLKRYGGVHLRPQIEARARRLLPRPKFKDFFRPEDRPLRKKPAVPDHSGQDQTMRPGG